MSLTFGGALDPGKNVADELQKFRHSCSSGAAWFYWIAGLSLVNSLILVFDGEWSFMVGLGVTQVIEAIAQALVADSVIENLLVIQIMALALDVGVAAVFVLLGWLAAKGLGWPFVVGMILYALDGLIFLLVQDWDGEDLCGGLSAECLSCRIPAANRQENQSQCHAHADACRGVLHSDRNKLFQTHWAAPSLPSIQVSPSHGPDARDLG